MARAYFPLFFDQYLSLCTNLSDDETGRLFRAMLMYAKEGIELGLGDREGVVWPLIRRDIDSSKQAYQRRCEINAANGRKGGRRRLEEAEETDRFVLEAEQRQAEEVIKAEEAIKAEKAVQAEKAKQAEQSEQEIKKTKPLSEGKGKESAQAHQATEAGGVDVVKCVENREELSFEERKKRAIAMLADDFIREQREKYGIRLPEHLRDEPEEEWAGENARWSACNIRQKSL